MRYLYFAQHLRLSSLLCDLASDVLLLALLIFHLSHAITLASLEVLAQRFEFNCFGLTIVILKQSFGLLLGQSLLVFHLQKFFVLDSEPTLRISQVASVLGYRSCDSL